MFLITIIILLIFKLFLAGKDATSYLLKEKHEENILTVKRINRWHRDGVALDLLFTIVLAWASDDWFQTIGQSIIIRAAIFDLAFNYWAQLNIHYLGSTALWDKLFIKIFGINGAVQKAIVFLAALTLWGLLLLC